MSLRLRIAIGILLTIFVLASNMPASAQDCGNGNGNCYGLTRTPIPTNIPPVDLTPGPTPTIAWEPMPTPTAIPLLEQWFGDGVELPTEVTQGDVTIPVDPGLVARALAHVRANPPVPVNVAPFYGVSYYQLEQNGDIILSVVAANKPDWVLYDVAWAGSIVLHSDGSSEYYQPPAEPVGYFDVPGLLNMVGSLNPLLAPGGGPGIVFPWPPGQKMLFGQLGTHNGFGVAQSLISIDWVGADSYGTSPVVYGSANGTVTFVCSDSISKAIWVNNAITDDLIYYYHFDTSLGKEVGATIWRGAPIGTLKYGSFGTESTNCGRSSNSADGYHLHWEIEPDGDLYQVGSWQYRLGDEQWVHLDGRTVNKLEWMTNESEIDPDGEGIIPPTTNGAHIWDGPLMALYGIFTAMADILPRYNSEGDELLSLISSGAIFVIRMINLFTAGIPGLLFIPMIWSFVLGSELVAALWAAYRGLRKLFF